MPIETIARPREQLVTATRTTPLREVGQQMQRHGIGSIVVVEDDEPVGIVTDRDLAMHVLTRDLDHGCPAEEVMTRDVVTIGADATARDACESMRRNKVRRLPIVDDGEMVGVVSSNDLFARIEEHLCDLAEVVRYETRPY